MTNTTSYPITVDGVRLDTLAYNVTGAKWRIPGVRSGAAVIPGVHGELPSYEDDYEPGGYVLSMWARGTDVDGVIPGDSVGQLRENLDTLLHLFSARHRLLDVRETVATGVERQAMCSVQDVIAPEVESGRVAQFKVDLIVPGAFWQDASITDWSQAPPVSGTTYDVTPLNGTTAPIQDGKFLVTGPITNPKIFDIPTGASVSYTGTIAGGSQWFVNCDTFASRVGSGLTLASADTDGSNAIAQTSFTKPNRLLTLVPARVSGVRKVQVKITGTGLSGATALGVRARRKFL